MTLKLMADRFQSFERIIERIVAGTGCAQLEHIITDQGNISEPLWRGGISIARNCKDWETTIHVISDKHPNYDPKETEDKAARLVDKPYRCEVFESLDPDRCKECPHKGKIKSPIVLGTDINRAESVEESVIEVDEAGMPVVYPIPPIPYPYFRGKNGGVYRDEKDEAPKLKIGRAHV